MRTDDAVMDYCLALARRGAGWASPNPLVGAAVVRDNCVVSAGWHRRCGGPHAEVAALRRGCPADGTLFVSLEPCCHHGRTPPCTDLLLRHQVRRVVAAMQDPHAKVAGRGLAQLRRHGVSVTVGVRERAARQLNRFFIRHITSGRPYVILKAGMTVDGAIAPRRGRRVAITPPGARADAARYRGEVDAVLIGSGTAVADNPRLTARGGRNLRQPLRVVLDTRGRLSPRLRVFSDGAAPTLWVTGPDVSVPRRRRTEHLALPLARDGQPDLHALLAALGERKIMSVLVEGGSEINAAFLRARLVDECRLYVAPRVLGGDPLPWLAKTAPRWHWPNWEVTRHDGWFLFTGRKEKS